MNERWLLWLVAVTALYAPRLRDLLLADSEEITRWIVFVNESGGPIELERVGSLLFPMDMHVGVRSIAPGTCVRIEARHWTGTVRAVWFGGGTWFRDLVDTASGETFSVGADGGIRPRPALTPADVDSCRPFWVGACEKGYVEPTTTAHGLPNRSFAKRLR